MTAALLYVLGALMAAGWENERNGCVSLTPLIWPLPVVAALVMAAYSAVVTLLGLSRWTGP